MTNIQFLRETHGLSQKDLAKIMGVYLDVVQDWDDPECFVNPRFTKTLSTLFDLPEPFFDNNSHFTELEKELITKLVQHYPIKENPTND